MSAELYWGPQVVSDTARSLVVTNWPTVCSPCINRLSRRKRIGSESARKRAAISSNAVWESCLAGSLWVVGGIL